MFKNATIRHEGVWYEVHLDGNVDSYPVLTTDDLETAKKMVMLLRGFDG